MENTVFNGLTFDVQKFVNHPKCVKAWNDFQVDPSGDSIIIEAGCLLTAFVRAFGLKTDQENILTDLTVETAEKYKMYAQRDLPFIRKEVEALVESLMPEIYETIRTTITRAIKIDANGNETTEKINLDWPFCMAVIEAYDYGEPEVALNLVWKLIEKLPNKVGYANIEDVVMPACGVK